MPHTFRLAAPALQAFARIRVTLIILAGLSLAACQTTGLKPGAITSSFAQPGWIATKIDGKTTYVCSPSRCRSPQVIVLVNKRFRGDLETAIRRDFVSAELFRAMSGVISVASKKAINITSIRKVGTRDYVGFDYLVTLRNRRGERLYLAAREIVQQDRGVMIISMATSSKLARANLRSYLAQTRIRRVK
ncbi:hypothetical protein [Stappia indica]|uniref:hypothetical protein n=1 Tax=Stappia indica TaxID=538381 RepID=UPI001CD4DDCF|nr:hypothetical protein [Stappia indica]MCA1299985.1 hypothetical protein [Stappia indica]